MALTTKEGQEKKSLKPTEIEILTKKLLKLAKGNSVYNFKKAAFRAMDECEHGTKI